MLGTANSTFARILFDGDIVEPMIRVEVKLPAKSPPVCASCSIVMREKLQRNTDLINVTEICLLATRSREVKLLPLMEERLRGVEIGKGDNLSALYLLMNGGGLHV